MIGTLTMNPCIDKTLEISNFHYGDINRVIKKRQDVSGKGINVSIALTNLGVPVRTFGLLYEKGGDSFLTNLQKLNINYEYVPVKGSFRENMKIYNNIDNITTELNQNGEFVSSNELTEFEKKLENTMESLDILVVTGSLPQGVDPSFYRIVIEKAKQHNIRCILDAEGELLKEGMKAKPYLIKPNLYEFKKTFGLETDNIDEIVEKCNSIIDQGIGVVCLSMGKQGAIITDGKEIFTYTPAEIRVKSTQGAGDSMVAGICMAIENKLGLSDMLRYGTAVAQGSLQLEGTQLCQKEDFEYLLDKIHVQTIKKP